MPATLTDVVNVRSQLVREVLRYLDTLATDMAVLPAYYPAHLRTDGMGTTRFDDIRQLVQVVQDRSVFEQWLAAERERLRAAGQNVDDRRAYAPFRARPEHEDADRAPDACSPTALRLHRLSHGTNTPGSVSHGPSSWAILVSVRPGCCAMKPAVSPVRARRDCVHAPWHSMTSSYPSLRGCRISTSVMTRWKTPW